ncbi:MAG: zinc-ribbon domain-containing protein [Xanthobacteraceae bacterium]
MQLACPSCHTAFHVEPAALGADGRHVRCARCRTTWFARPDDLTPGPAMAEASAEAAAGAGTETVPAVVLPRVVPWNDTVMVEVSPSPPLAPGAPQGMESPMVTADDAGRPSVAGSNSGKRRKTSKSSPGQRRLVAATALVAAVLFAVIGPRASLVRSVPDLAGFYAAIGMPVNLRGLEFNAIRTTHEMQDGIPVLVIEGEITNVTRQPVEVPRLRLAVLGPDSSELYSWTALLPRSVLPEGESLPFRSRLASPPVDGKDVLVRFLNRLDLTANGR